LKYSFLGLPKYALPVMFERTSEEILRANKNFRTNVEKKPKSASLIVFFSTKIRPSFSLATSFSSGFFHMTEEYTTIPEKDGFLEVSVFLDLVLLSSEGPIETFTPMVR
jgi:hypothetical protein